MSNNYDSLRRIPPPFARPSVHPIRASELPASAFDPLDEAPVTAYISALWRRKWTVIGFATFCVLVVGAIWVLMKPAYLAVARVAIYGDRQGLLTVHREVTAG